MKSSIIKLIKNNLNKFICSCIGHKCTRVIEVRNRVHGMHRYTVRKGGSKGSIRNVTGYYSKCSRCGKKLSGFKSF